MHDILRKDLMQNLNMYSLIINKNDKNEHSTRSLLNITLLLKHEKDKTRK